MLSPYTALISVKAMCYLTHDMCMLCIVTVFMLFVNIYIRFLYVNKTVAHIQLVLYHNYQAPKRNDRICEIGRFSFAKIEGGGNQ